MMMQGSIADSADQDQKRVVPRFTVRSGLSYPFLIFGFILSNEWFLFDLFSMLWINRRLNCGMFKLERKKSLINWCIIIFSTLFNLFNHLATKFKTVPDRK